MMMIEYGWWGFVEEGFRLVILFERGGIFCEWIIEDYCEMFEM